MNARVPSVRRVRETTLATGLRDVVWADIREGLPRLSDLHSTTRILGVLGILVIVAAALQLIFIDGLRDDSLLVAGHADLGGRVQLVPLGLAPLTLATLTVAWTFLLTGAARAHWSVLLAVAVMFFATSLVWIAGAAPTASPGQRMLPLAAMLLAGGAAAASRRAPRLWLLPIFAVVLALVALAYGAVNALRGAQVDPVAVENPIITLGLLLSLAAGLALPLLVVLGFGLAVFAYRAASWVGDTAASAAHGWALPAAVGVLAIACVAVAGTSVVGAWGETTAWGWIGALLFVVLPLAGGTAALRWARGGGAQQAVDETALVQAADRSIPKVAAALFAPMVVVTVGLLVTSAVGAAITVSGGVGLPAATDAAINRAANAVTNVTGIYRLGFVVGAAAVGAALLRRRTTLGLYLLVLGATHGWTVAVAGPLAGLHWDDASQVAVWLAVGVVAKLVVDVVGGDLHRRRQRNYVVALSIVLLFGQVGVLDNPFHPVFALTGVALVTVALALDTLTLGGWANAGSAWLPRESRLPLYVGYAVFSLALVTWAAGTHDFEAFDLFTGDAAAGGLRLFGDPLLLSLIGVLVLTRPATAQPEPAGAPDVV